MHALEPARILQGRGDKATLRNASKLSKKGVSHPEPIDIPSMFKKCFEHSDRPYLKYLLINYVKPLDRCNKKLSKIILANDLNYDFDTVNELVENDVDSDVNSLCKNYSIDVFMT